MTDLVSFSNFFMISGFLLAAYSVVANDCVQTLGTFMASNSHRRWWVLWLFASTILIATLLFSWFAYNGDISQGRLDSIPYNGDFQWYHMVAPLILVFMTRFGIPVSTTFLVISVFASSVVIEKVILKSVMGYGVAAIVAYSLWWILSKFLDEHDKVDPKNRNRWFVAQWLTTGFLWFTWLSHDMANIAVYMPRKLSVSMLLVVFVVLISGLALTFYSKGGRIQKIVLDKTGTRYARSATIIDFVFACILLVFKEWSTIPMSTTWVFVGLLCGRELAIHSSERFKGTKAVFPIIAKDFAKVLVGLGVSLVLVWIIQWTKAI